MIMLLTSSYKYEGIVITATAWADLTNALRQNINICKSWLFASTECTDFLWGNHIGEPTKI